MQRQKLYNLQRTVYCHYFEDKENSARSIFVAPKIDRTEFYLFRKQKYTIKISCTF